MKLPLFSILALVTLPALAQTPAAPSGSTSVTPTPVAQQPDGDTAPPPAPGGDTGAPAVPPGASKRMEALTSTLTPEERKRVADLKTKAMTTDPDLQAAQMDLMQKGMALQDGSATPEDQQAFKQQLKDFLGKLRAAMIKLDPTIEPVLDKIEAQSKVLQAKHGAAAGAGDAGSQ